MTMIYLVQHGDKERMPGDPGLTELGRGQAAVTARWLQAMGLHSLYSSPLRVGAENGTDTLQSDVSIVTVALIVARAVNILK